MSQDRPDIDITGICPLHAADVKCGCWVYADQPEEIHRHSFRFFHGDAVHHARFKGFHGTVDNPRQSSSGRYFVVWTEHMGEGVKPPGFQSNFDITHDEPIVTTGDMTDEGCGVEALDDYLTKVDDRRIAKEAAR